mmetsp:Transcript_95866/g.200381  ORF Transcript_95866/g.200381 Transcript_95866/m.200381 type:complete len:213 (+) Transcript_95866:150-788(+)
MVLLPHLFCLFHALGLRPIDPGLHQALHLAARTLPGLLEMLARRHRLPHLLGMLHRPRAHDRPLRRPSTAPAQEEATPAEANRRWLQRRSRPVRELHRRLTKQSDEGAWETGRNHDFPTFRGGLTHTLRSPPTKWRQSGRCRRTGPRVRRTHLRLLARRHQEPRRSDARPNALRPCRRLRGNSRRTGDARLGSESRLWLLRHNVLGLQAPAC